jgi:hypothetical protein
LNISHAAISSNPYAYKRSAFEQTYLFLDTEMPKYSVAHCITLEKGTDGHCLAPSAPVALDLQGLENMFLSGVDRSVEDMIVLIWNKCS